MYYVADFETLTLDGAAKADGCKASDYKIDSNSKGTKQPWTSVWAWAIVPTVGPYDMSAVKTGTSMESFIRTVDHMTRDDDVVYFHNLDFDGTFIINWLLDNGYHRIEYNRRNKHKQGFNVLSGEIAGYYSIEVTISSKHIQFVDSLKLLPFTVYEIGRSFGTQNKKLLIDYDEHHVIGKALTKKEKEYVANDVLVVAEAIQKTYLDAGMDKITVGSNAMADYIDICGGKDQFRKSFPELSPEEHAFVSHAYRGGISYVKKGIEGRVFEQNGLVLDVHSMYPSVMHSDSGNYYPVGEGDYFQGTPPADMLWVAHIVIDAVVKPEHMPCLQIRKTGRWADNEFVEDTKGPVDIYCTSVDWELIEKQYILRSVYVVDGYAYKGERGLFDIYIDKWYTVKSTTKGAEKQRAKLMLNSFYGKFATTVDTVNLIPYLDSNGVVRHTRSHSHVKSVYIPVGAFVTAYARRKLINVVQANWDRFLYCDTDSAHLLGTVEDVKEAVITDSELNTWGIESEFVKAKYLRQKTYIEQAPDGHIEVRCAGLPKSHPVQHGDTVTYEGPREYINFDNFDFDYDFESDPRFNACKLNKKRVKGGIILVPGPFSIRR